MAKRGRKSIVSSVIDPLLIEGGRTVAEIADLVMDALKDKTDKEGEPFLRSAIINNVRQRMVVLPRYGYQMAKDGFKRIKFTKEVETTVNVISETVVRKSNKEITR